MSERGFDMKIDHVHLSLGARATRLPNFEWSQEGLERYSTDFASDGSDGRLVMLGDSTESWTNWERHPAGEEVVVLISGRADLIREIDGELDVVELHAGEFAINPTGVWHTSDVHEPGQVLFITPGIGTEHKPR